MDKREPLTPRYVEGDHKPRVHFGCGLIAGAVIALLPAGAVWNLSGNWWTIGFTYLASIAAVAFLAGRYGEKFWYRALQFLGKM